MIRIHHIDKVYPLSQGRSFAALRNVTFQIHEGEILGLVGESGSGKSTLARILLGLLEPTTGEILIDGVPVTGVRPRHTQMVFQDPYSSLNPRMNVETLLAEPTRIHNLPNRVDELLDLVQLPLSCKKRYPHEFSGGQRQRIGIARALALNPKFLICDEPISALDVSIQAQIVNLLQELQQTLHLTILFIAHDLAMVRHLSERVAVLFQGQIVELRHTEELFATPRHPYTQLLLNAAT